MSRFFEPVEFEEPKEEKKPEPVVDEFPVDVSNFVIEFNRIIQAVQSGTSGIVKGGIQLKGAPMLIALERFAKTPTALTFRVFLDLAKQDINNRARMEFLNVVSKNADKKLKEFLSKKGFV